MNIPRTYMHTVVHIEKANCSNKNPPRFNEEDLFLSLWVCGQKILVPTPKEWYLGN